MATIKVSQEVLIAIAKTCNLENLQNDKAKSFQYMGQKYVSTGFASTAAGYKSVWCCKAVLPQHYDGDVVPMNNDDHVKAVLQGLRDRGYLGRLLEVDGVPHILTDSVDFIQEEIKVGNCQLKLFDIEPIEPVAETSLKKTTIKNRKEDKRKYNASYRLRRKLGKKAFPKKSKNIFCELGDLAIENIKEIKILTKEYGFAVKPLAFSNL